MGKTARYNPDKHHRRSIRLRDFDYTQSGAYFVTFCTWRRECVLGEIVDGVMKLNEYGESVNRCWRYLPEYFQVVEMDQFIIMPNHAHGIIIIKDMHAINGCRGGVTPPLRVVAEHDKLDAKMVTLGQIIGFMKYNAAKTINEKRDSPGTPVWQRNYYERIIRNQGELSAMRRYVRDNPLKWDNDHNNPRNFRSID